MELKECPFCDNSTNKGMFKLEVEIDDKGIMDLFRVKCFQCGGTQNWHLLKSDAIKRWTMRRGDNKQCQK